MRIVLFQPFSGIWQHAILEQQLLKSLNDQNHDLFIIGCGSTFDSLCTARENYGLKITSSKEEMNSICEKCTFSTRLMEKSVKNVTTLMMSEFISNQEKLEIKKSLEDLTKLKLLDKEALEKEFVRASLHDLVLRYKIRDLNLNDEEFDYFMNSASNYLIVKSAATRIISSLNPDLLLIHSPQYCSNSAMAKVASKMGIKTYYLGANTNLGEQNNSLRVYDWEKYMLLNPAPTNKKYTPERSLKSRNRIRDHIRMTEKAKSVFVYSQPKDSRSVRVSFDIPKQNKIILLAMSSYDEFFAAELGGYFGSDFRLDRVFKNQSEWVEKTIEWAERQEGITLIVRPHPRELPNKRETRTAPRDPKLIRILGAQYRNVIIDDGTSKFPMQNYFNEIDLLLISWSSTGIDALLAGVPVIAYDNSLFKVPKDLILSGDSEVQYFKNIDLTICKTNRRENTGPAFAWFDYSQNFGSLLLPGRIHDSPFFRRIPFLKSLTYRFEKRFWKFLWTIESLNPLKIDRPAKFKELIRAKADSFYEL